MKTLTITVAAIIMVSAVQAQVVHVLTRQWIDNGRFMCQYSNGSILAMSNNRTCPSTIRA
jgi:hypothetical protein